VAAVLATSEYPVKQTVPHSVPALIANLAGLAQAFTHVV